MSTNDSTPDPTADERGLEARFYVRKMNDSTGKHTECRYFVLDPQHDTTARAALAEYARQTPNKALRRDLWDWLEGSPAATPDADAASTADPTAGQRCDDRGPRIGEDGTRCRKPKGHVGNHAVAPEDGFGVVEWIQWYAPPAPDADASTPTSEGLTEDEREALGDWWESDWPDTKEGAIGSLYAVVAQIKADAEAKARAEERERIAQAIEDGVLSSHPSDHYKDGFRRAAHIARSGA